MKPWVAGSVISLVAVVASSFWITDPPVYGFCVACHTRDLVAGTTPLLTGVGLLIGGHLAARRFREFRFRRPKLFARKFFIGMVAMIASLLALGCTARILLRAAYGEATAWWAVLGVAVGIGVGTWRLRINARRGMM